MVKKPSWMALLWLGAVVLVLPLVQLPVTGSDTVQGLWLWLMAAVCLALALLRPAGGSYPKSSARGGMRVLFIFVLTYAIGLPDALHLGEAFVAWGRMAQALLVVYLTWQALQEGKEAHVLLGRLAVMSALAQSLVALPVVAADLHPGWLPAQVHQGTIGLSEWMVVLLPLVAYAILLEKGWWQRLAWASATLVALCVLLTVARASLIGMMAGALTGGLLTLLLRRRLALQLRWKPFALSAAAVLVMLGAVWALEPATGPIHRMGKKWSLLVSHPPAESYPTGLSERQALWDGTADMLQDHWTQGVGPGHWRFHAPRYHAYSFRLTYADRFFSHPHNDLLWIWSEGGLPALVAWLGLMGWQVVVMVNLLRRGDRERLIQAVLWASGWTAFLVMGMMSYPLKGVASSTQFWVLMAMGISLSRGEGEPAKPWRPMRVMQVALLLLSLGCGTVLALRLPAEWRLSAVRRQVESGTKTNMQDAHPSSTWLVADEVGIPAATWEGLLARQTGRREAEAGLLEDGTYVSPYHPPVLVEAARTAMGHGGHDQAAAWLRAAISIHPCHFEARLLLAEAYLRSNRPALAKDALRVEQSCTSHWLHRDFRQRADALLEIMPQSVSLDSLLP